MPAYHAAFTALGTCTLRGLMSKRIANGGMDPAALDPIDDADALAEVTLALTPL